MDHILQLRTTISSLLWRQHMICTTSFPTQIGVFIDGPDIVLPYGKMQSDWLGAKEP